MVNFGWKRSRKPNFYESGELTLDNKKGNYYAMYIKLTKSKVSNLPFVTLIGRS